jgi:uncharacterized protein YkwD
MHKKIFPIFFIATLLVSCISVSVESQETAQANFVTATLVPTKEGFVPATLTRAPEATQTLTLASPAPAGCTDSAVLLRDVTIPDNTQVNPGEKFTKTWEFQNNGTCPWVNYTLGFAAGDQMNAPLSAPIQTSMPGGKVNVSVELTAPSSNGTYTGYFTLNDASGGNLPIGIEKTFWVKIVVGSASPQATAQGSIVITPYVTPYVPAGGNSNCAYSPNAGYVQQLIALINQARASVNLHALSVNAQLMSAAQAHSGDMACNNFLGHTSSDGSWIGDRLKAAGYNTYSYQEIIAIGTPQNAMDQWASDAPHWESVLNPYVTEIGVGYAYFSGSDFGGYITVDFAGQ